jgi:hypothetical protein
LPPDQSLQPLEACRFTRSGATPKQQQPQVHNGLAAVNYPAPVIRNTEGATELAMMRHPAVSQSIPDELVNICCNIRLRHNVSDCCATTLLSHCKRGWQPHETTLSDQRLSLHQLISQLKEEVALIQESGNPLFSVGEVSVTTKFVIEETATGGGKASFWVLTINGDLASKSQDAHEVTLKLKPIDEVYLGEKKERAYRMISRRMALPVRRCLPQASYFRWLPPCDHSIGSGR